MSLFAAVFVCVKHASAIRTFIIMDSSFACVCASVCFHAMGLCGLVLLAIDRAAQLRLLMG